MAKLCLVLVTALSLRASAGIFLQLGSPPVPAAALSFDGSNETAATTATDDTILGSASPAAFTIHVCARAAVAPSQYDTVFGSASSGGWSNGWGLFFNSATQVRFWAANYATHKVEATTTPTAWHCYTGRFTTDAGTGTDMDLLIDGVSAGTYHSGTHLTSFITAHPVRLAYLIDGSSYANVVICGAAIWNRWVSNSEVTALNQQKCRANYRNLAGTSLRLWAPIRTSDSPSAASGILDYSGNGYHFTGSNMEAGDLVLSDLP